MSTAIANQLFLAYMGRPADAAWRASTATVLNGNQPSAALQTAFYNAAVSEGVFSSTDTLSSLVNKIFLQTFGFAASTFEQTAWASTGVSKEAMAWTIFSSYLGATNVPDLYKLPTQSKLMAVDAYINQLQNDGTANAALSQGGTAATSARTQITGVTSQATAATFITNVVSNVSTSTVSSGSNFTLTTGADTGNLFIGGAGADTFNGALGGSGNNVQTLNSSDVLNGGGGTDTLFATLNGGVASPRLTSIESLSITDVTAVATLDLTNSTGYNSIENTGSTHLLTTSNINSTNGVALKYANSSTGATFNYTAAAVAGAADSATLTLSNVTGGTVTMTAGVETLNIVSADGANTVVLSGSASPNIVTSGSQNLALGQLAAASTNINASTATGTFSATLGAAVNATINGSQGADTIDVSAVTGNLSVDTGAGNDNVIATAGITLTDTINGGAGTADVLTITSAQLATLAAATPTTYNITNIERITSTTVFDGNQILTNVATGIDTLTLNLTGASIMTGGDDTITGGAGSLTVNLGGTLALQTAGVLAGAMVVVAGGTAGTADSLTLNSRAVATLGINTFGSQDITSTGYERVTIDSNSAVGGAALTFANLAINTDSALSTPTSLTLTGANQIQNIVGKAISTNSTGLFTINASGMTAQNAGTQTLLITSTSSGTAGTQSITGSGGDDSITVGAFAATIDGGAGQDTLTGGTSNDSIIGGDGNDTIGTGNGNNTVLGGAGLDTITAGTGNDSLSGGDGNDAFIMAVNLTANDTIDGGAGTNTLSMTASANASAAFANVTNIQTVTLTGTATVALAAPLAASVTTYDLSEAAVNNLTFATGFTGATTVLLTNGAVTNGTNQDVITNNANIALTVRGNDSAFNTVQVVGGTGTDALVMTAASGTASLTNTSGIETITMAVAAATPTATSAITNAVVATTKTLTVDASAMTNASTTFGFSGKASQLGGVNVTGATAAVNTIDLSNFAGGNTVTGGAGDDLITSGTGVDSLSGGAGSDAYVFGTALLNTDTVSDSAGTADTLNATINGLTATTGALSISGVETLNLLTATAASTINAAGIVGTTRANVAGAQPVTFTNLAAGNNLGLGTSTSGGFNGTSGYSGTLTFGLANAAGAADAVTVTLTNANANDVNATLVAAAGIETVTLAASTVEASTLNVSGVVTPTLNLTGGLAAKVLTLGTLNAATTTVGAGSFSGQMVVQASASNTAITTVGTNAAGTAVLQSIAGGAGNDTITMTAVGTGIHSVQGGTGTDTLNMSLNAATFDMSAVTTFENINLTLASNSAHSPGANVAAFNDAVLTNISLTGGNSLSTFTSNTTAIGSGAAFKSFSAAGVSGVVDVTVVSAALGLGDSVTGGSGTSDVLRVTNTGTTVTAGTVSGFESMVITTSTNDNGTQSFTNTTGLNAVTVAGPNTMALTGLSAGVAVTVGVAGGTALTDNKGVSATLTTNTGAADAMTFNLANASATTTGITLTAPGIETVTLSQSTAAANSNFAVALRDTNTTNPVNIVMNGGIAGQTITFVSGGLETNVAKVEASSTYASNLIMASGSRTGTAAMTITGGSGNDTIIMKQANDVLDGGTNGTTTNVVNDTLNIVANAVLGGFLVDLTSTTDQVQTYNGSANAAIQKGFENVDLSGITGNFGADITARAAGSNIVGTLNADQITGGTGVDTITGGAGADVITGGAGNDVFVFSGTAELVAANAAIDLIDGGAGTTDAIRLDGATTLAATDLLARITNVEQITASPTTGVISITATASVGGSTFTGTQFNRIDLSGDTNATGTNVVSITGVTGISTITGSAGIDTITLGSAAVSTTVTGGSGIDAIILAANALPHTLVYTALSDSQSGVGAAIVSGTTNVVTTGFDQVASSLVTGQTLIINLNAFNSGTYTAGAIILAATGVVPLSGTAGTIGIATGTVAANVFTSTTTTPTTTIVQYDTNGATAGGLGGISITGVVISAAVDATGLLTLTF